MLRASLLTNAEILPQARQGSYFFNRIGQKQSFAHAYFKPDKCGPSVQKQIEKARIAGTPHTTNPQ